MTKIDNSKIFLGGVYADAAVNVPAQTTYKEGTVLARNADGYLTAYTSANDTDSFTCETFYILAQRLVNEAETAADVALARVYECGPLNKEKLIFINTADASSVTVQDKLRQNGFSLETVTELTEETSLNR